MGASSACRSALAPPTNCLASQWLGLSEQISLCGRLLRTRLAERTEKAGLGESQLSLLWTCMASSEEGISQIELAQRLLISPALVSGLVEQLRRRRLLHGHRDKDDRRRQLWRVTASGRALVQGILEDVTAWARQLDGRLGTRNVELLSVLLGQLIGTLSTAASARHEPVPLDHELPEAGSRATGGQQKGAAA